MLPVLPGSNSTSGIAFKTVKFCVAGSMPFFPNLRDLCSDFVKVCQRLHTVFIPNTDGCICQVI